MASFEGFCLVMYHQGMGVVCHLFLESMSDVQGPAFVGLKIFVQQWRPLRSMPMPNPSCLNQEIWSDAKNF